MDELLTVKQVAEIFSVSERTIWRWVDAEILTPVRIGKRTVRFPRSSVEALLSHD